MQNKFDKKDIDAALHLITSANSVTLLTHKNPDPDGISACAALSDWLCEMGKKVETIYLNATEYAIVHDPANILINKHSHIPDLIIVCDTANYERIYYPELFKKVPLINIDHHISNAIAGTVNLVDGAVSSTCELLLFLLKAWSVTISKNIAESLLYGMMYDTQIFQTQPTNAQTLRVAAELVDAGAQIFPLKLLLDAHKNSKNIKLWGTVLQNLEVVKSSNAVIACVTQQDLKAAGVERSALLGLNNFIATMPDIDVMIFMYQEASGAIRVSLRSKVTDVNALASHFKGGGHKFASGFVSDLQLSDLKQKLIDFL